MSLIIICFIISLYGFRGVAYEGHLAHCKGRIDPFWRLGQLNGIIVLGAARGRPRLSLVVLGSTGQGKVRVVGETWRGLLLRTAAGGEIFIEPARFPSKSLSMLLL